MKGVWIISIVFCLGRCVFAEFTSSVCTQASQFEEPMCSTIFSQIEPSFVPEVDLLINPREGHELSGTGRASSNTVSGSVSAGNGGINVPTVTARVSDVLVVVDQQDALQDLNDNQTPIFLNAFFNLSTRAEGAGTLLGQAVATASGQVVVSGGGNFHSLTCSRQQTAHPNGDTLRLNCNFPDANRNETLQNVRVPISLNPRFGPVDLRMSARVTLSGLALADGSMTAAAKAGFGVNSVEGLEVVDDDPFYDLLVLEDGTPLKSLGVGFNVLPIPGPRGDADFNGTLDSEDINALLDAIEMGSTASENGQFELTGDLQVDGDDTKHWVEVLRNTYFGDANLDGEFNSSDLVVVFQSGLYEDSIERNSKWEDGDWNGDREFDTSDLIIAFQAGGFEQGPRIPEVAAAVPEPTTSILFGLIVLALFCSAGRVREANASAGPQPS